MTSPRGITSVEPLRPKTLEPIQPRVERIKVLVYGPPKSGKTWGAGTFPRPNFLDFDGGIATLRSRAFRERYPNAQIMYAQFRERDVVKGGVPRTHNAFDDACRYFDLCMSDPAIRDSFDTWVIDSGTSLSDAAMAKAVVLLGDRSFAGSNPISLTHKKALETGLLFPRQADWGSERSLTEQFIQMVLDTDKNVVLLCHDKEVEGDVEGMTQVVPLLTGRGVAAVARRFDEVWYLKAERRGNTRVHYLITEPGGRYMAGSRYGVPTGTPWTYEDVTKALETVTTKN